MSAHDSQSDPALVAGAYAEPVASAYAGPAGADEPAAPAGNQPGPTETSARAKPSPAGLIRGIKRGLVGFAAGFQGATWDDKAGQVIRDDLRAISEMGSLPDADMRELETRIEPLLESQRDFLRSEAAVKAVANRVTWVLCICAVALPAVVVGLTAAHGGDAVWLYFFTLLGVLMIATWPAHILQMLSGRTGPGLIWAALVIWAYIAAAVLSAISSGPSDPDRGVFVAVVGAAAALTIVLVARVYIVAWNEIALMHAWAERRLEAVVVCLLLGVIQVLGQKTGKDGPPALHVVRVLVAGVDEKDPPTPLQRSGRARGLLSQAAWTVSQYLPRLIDGGGAYSGDAQSIASEAAAALLGLRSAVNLPGGHLRKADIARLTKAAEAWSIGSLADLPRTTWLTANSLESANRRTGLLQVVRNLLLGALPLILLIAATLLPVTMPAAVTATLAPFAVTWLLVAIASVLAPADVKMDIKTLLGH